ncbi:MULTISPECIES: hypothetical protein [unclassified Microcoleus]
MLLPTLTVISCSHATNVRSSIICRGDRKDSIAPADDIMSDRAIKRAGF